MKFLKSYKLFESKVTQPELYHLLDIEKLNYVIDTDKIKSYRAGGGKISTTRNFLLNGYLGDNVSTMFKLVIDWEKLEKDYETKPFVYRSYTGIDFNEEEEQQVQTNEIKDVWKYVKSVLLIKNRVESLKKSLYDGLPTGWFTSVGAVHGQQLPTVIKEIKEKLENKGIPFYTQSGDKIEKNYEYINSIINYPITYIEERWVIVYRGRIGTEHRFKSIDVLTDSKGDIITDDVVIGRYIDIDDNRFDIIEFKDFKSVKKQIKNFLEVKQFPHLPKYKYQDGFEPYVAKFERIKNKWKLDDLRPTRVLV